MKLVKNPKTSKNFFRLKKVAASIDWKAKGFTTPVKN